MNLLHLILQLISVSMCRSLKINPSVTHFKSFRLLRGSRAIKASTEPASSPILRKLEGWACVKNCGACCKLGPLDSRPDLDSYLNAEELELYKSMIGDDDWCINFDKNSRLCKIYESRPNFCQVDPDRYKKMFSIELEDFSDFCTFCCREQIEDVYGMDSKEMSLFETVNEDVADENDGNYELVDYSKDEDDYE